MATNRRPPRAVRRVFPYPVSGLKRGQGDTNMAYRYCPECDRWLETSEYTVDSSGETVCPEHRAVHGYIDGSIRTEADLRQNLGYSHTDVEAEVEAALRQGLVE